MIESDRAAAVAYLQVGAAKIDYGKAMRSMGSFGFDFGVGFDLFLKWLKVMFGLDFDVGIS